MKNKQLMETHVIDNIVTQIKPQTLYSKYSKKYNQTSLLKLADIKFYKQKGIDIIKNAKDNIPSIIKLKEINKKDFEFKNSESKKYLTQVNFNEPEKPSISYLSKSKYKSNDIMNKSKYVLDFNINYNSIDKKLPSVCFIRDKFTNLNISSDSDLNSTKFKFPNSKFRSTDYHFKGKLNNENKNLKENDNYSDNDNLENRLETITSENNYNYRTRENFKNYENPNTNANTNSKLHFTKNRNKIKMIKLNANKNINNKNIRNYNQHENKNNFSQESSFESNSFNYTNISNQNKIESKTSNKFQDYYANINKVKIKKIKLYKKSLMNPFDDNNIYYNRNIAKNTENMKEKNKDSSKIQSNNIKQYPIIKSYEINENKTEVENSTNKNPMKSEKSIFKSESEKNVSKFNFNNYELLSAKFKKINNYTKQKLIKMKENMNNSILYPSVGTYNPNYSYIYDNKMNKSNFINKF